MPAPAPRQIHTVSQVNRLARTILEQELPTLWISGEISNLARPASGHVYFSLKDERAQLRCAMFRSRNRGLGFRPANGQQVLVRGRLSIYEPRGDYQLIAEHMEPAGEGLLRQRFEELKQRLAAEGLFDPARKRTLPELPRQVGVITSPGGAAIRDILHVLRRRFAPIPVVLYPVQVQGERARHEIEAALALAGHRAECDVLILARGGGSLEDLWAFNEENVARAIAACPIPVISGVGHETDFTIADLVADVRAPTPSGAAELAVPDSREWLRHLHRLSAAMALAVERQLQRHLDSHHGLHTRLVRQHPGQIVRQNAQRLDELRLRLDGARRRSFQQAHQRLDWLRLRLSRASPATVLNLRAERFAHMHQRLLQLLRQRLERARHRLSLAAGQLQVVSPLSTLERGYALVQDHETGTVIRDTGQLRPQQRIDTRVARGSFVAVIESVDPGDDRN